VQINERINCTRHLSGLGLCLDREGREHAVAVLKATYRFDSSGRLTIAEGDGRVPVFAIDLFHDKPDNSGLRFASDITHTKPGTDVAIVGTAPGGGERSREIGFRVAGLEKILVATGARVHRNGLLGSIDGPQPFCGAELRYELAFGGAFLGAGGERDAYPFNPIGVGYVPESTPEVILPTFEYREDRYKNVKSRPRPAGLGFLPSHWRPRAEFAGTFDAAWMESRRPLFPADFDERYYNTVPQDQVVLPKLQGGERVTLQNLLPEREQLSLAIPAGRYRATFRVRDQVEEVPMLIDTLLIEPDHHRLALTYRSALPIGPHFRLLKTVTFQEVRSA
jgi:hypothetical protein